jgi:hypothetical protein
VAPPMVCEGFSRSTTQNQTIGFALNVQGILRGLAEGLAGQDGLWVLKPVPITRYHFPCSSSHAIVV